MSWKSLAPVFCIGFSLTLSGCVLGQSLDPFFTKEVAVGTPAELAGEWRSVKEPDDQSLLVISQGRIGVVGKDAKVEQEFKVQFFRVDGQLFLDYFVDMEKIEPRDTQVYLLPTHSLMKVDFKDGQLILLGMDISWVKSQNILKFKTLSGTDSRDEIIISDTADLVEFLRKYKDNPQAFPAGEQIILARRPASPANQ